MSRGWARWVAVWCGDEAPTALAAIRIGVAACVLFDLLYAAVHGLAPVIWASPSVGGLGQGFVEDPPLVARVLGVHADAITFGLAVGLSVCLLIGCASRVAALALGLVLAQLGWLAPDADRGIDIVFRLACLILAASGAGACWSVDAWWARRRGRPLSPLVARWPRRLLAAQLLWVYFSAGQSKLSPTWLPQGGFSALGLTLADPHFARFGPGWVASIYPLTQAATGLTLVFELGAPLLILRGLVPRVPVRGSWVVLGVVFHLGIALTLRLGIFPLGMLVLYPALFTPAELTRAVSLAGRWVRKGTSTQPGG